MSIKHLYEDERPTLLLDFANSKTLDPRITFTRNSTATYVDEQGIIRTAADNEPRFDHNGATGECLGLLIEESKTNNITNSVAFQGYTTRNCSLTNNVSSAPDGTTTAAQMTEAAGYGGHHFFLSAAPGVATVAQSIFVKGIGRDYASLRFYTANQDWYVVVFELTGAGSITQETYGSSASFTATSSITSVANGWYRITAAATNPGTQQAHPLIFGGSDSANPGLASGDGQVNYTGDATKGYYVWGAQWEDSTYSTSYIPTSGSTVQRASDVCNITGSNFDSWYNDTEGTLVLDISIAKTSGYAISFRIGGGSTVITGHGGLAPFNGLAYFSGSGSPKYLGYQNQNKYLLPSTPAKVAYNWDMTTGEATVCLGPHDALTLTGFPVVTPLSYFMIFSTSVSSSMNTGHVSKISYYNTRLSSTALEALTK